MMAAKLHLSPSHLQALYHHQFGSSCMDNVIEGRLRRAQDLLEYSEYSIRDISEQCGYNNVEHFCRQVPSAYARVFEYARENIPNWN